MLLCDECPVPVFNVQHVTTQWGGEGGEGGEEVLV